MFKRIRNLMMVAAIVIQVIVFFLYGFSEMQASNVSCLALWCVCAAVVYFMGRSTRIA